MYLYNPFDLIRILVLVFITIFQITIIKIYVFIVMIIFHYLKLFFHYCWYLLNSIISQYRYSHSYGVTVITIIIIIINISFILFHVTAEDFLKPQIEIDIMSTVSNQVNNTSKYYRNLQWNSLCILLFIYIYFIWFYIKVAAVFKL